LTVYSLRLRLDSTGSIGFHSDAKKHGADPCTKRIHAKRGAKEHPSVAIILLKIAFPKDTVRGKGADFLVGTLFNLFINFEFPPPPIMDVVVKMTPTRIVRSIFRNFGLMQRRCNDFKIILCNISNISLKSFVPLRKGQGRKAMPSGPSFPATIDGHRSFSLFAAPLLRH
jgi:hypothetical protein